MAAEKVPSAEDLALWLKPHNALSIIQRSFPKTEVAARAVMERLKGGKIVAAANSSSWEDGTAPTSITLIPASYWSKLSGQKDDWWDTGDVRFWFSRPKHDGHSGAARFYGVRFSSDGIEEILRDNPPPRRVSPEEPTPAQREMVDKALAVERSKSGRSSAPVSIPIDEYARWLSPRQAIERLKPVASATVIDALAAGIRSGAIRAAAHRIIMLWPDEPPKQIGVYTLLSPGRWIEQAEDRFWQLGSITVVSAAERVPNRDEGAKQELTGVRLDPMGVENLAAQLGEIALPATPPEDPPLPSETLASSAMTADSIQTGRPLISDAKLKVWLTKYAEKHPRAVHRDIKRDAEDKFLGFRIGKNQLYRVMRDVYGRLNIGNPTFSRS